MRFRVLWLVVLASLVVSGRAAPNQLERGPQTVRLQSGTSFRLNLPVNLELHVAAQGLGRARFMAQSPDGRVFVTNLYNLSDNRRGQVYILSDFNPQTGTFQRRQTYLSGLHNPNSLAFYTDSAGRDWLYLALTDQLQRYRFTRGETSPTQAPQVLARFPAYGQHGWHLTRTVTIGPDARVYVSVGSSCNACVEKEAVRASILVMDLDGQHQRSYARGLRNAVGLRFVGKQLYATDMGADHLGDNLPNDHLYAIQAGTDYGWPYCYIDGARVRVDQKYNPGGKNRDCSRVPAPMASLPAHSAPLGLEFFPATSAPDLRDAFLVGLHGSGFVRIGRGYGVWRVAKDGSSEPLIDGFLSNGKIFGRPVDVMAYQNGFLFSDDYAGVVYYVSPRS